MAGGMIRGLSHITLIVRDLDLAGSFLETVFGAQCVYDSGEHTFSHAPERFYMVGELWFCIMQGTPHVDRTYDHIALQISDEDVDLYMDRIRAVGAEMLPPRPRVEGEGQSLYFYDFDNHLFELHTGKLPERLARYQRG